MHVLHIIIHDTSIVVIFNSVINLINFDYRIMYITSLNIDRYVINYNLCQGIVINIFNEHIINQHVRYPQYSM